MNIDINSAEIGLFHNLWGHGVNNVRLYPQGGQMMVRICTTMVLLMVVGTNARGQEKSAQSYDQMLAAVKKHDPNADFTKLRMAFTQTANYRPYDNTSKVTQAMSAALEKKDFKSALALAEKVLQTRYVDLQAHLVAYRANTELKNTEQAKHHKYMFDGLLDSIIKSGNGKATSTAYVVISMDEETVLLEAMRIRQSKQSLVIVNDKKYDQIEGVEQKSNQAVRVFFNVTTQFTWLQRQGKGK